MAAGNRQNGQLRRLCLAVLFGGTQEKQKFSVRRPARRQVMIAFCQLMRLLAPRDRYRPDRGIITLLFFIYRYAHKSDTQSVRRNLRIADPHKIEKIFFGNVAPLPERAAIPYDKSEKNDEVRMTKPEVRITKSTTMRHFIRYCF